MKYLTLFSTVSALNGILVHYLLTDETASLPGVVFSITLVGLVGWSLNQATATVENTTHVVGKTIKEE